MIENRIRNMGTRSVEISGELLMKILVEGLDVTDGFEGLPEDVFLWHVEDTLASQFEEYCDVVLTFKSSEWVGHGELEVKLVPTTDGDTISADGPLKTRA